MKVSLSDFKIKWNITPICWKMIVIWSKSQLFSILNISTDQSFHIRSPQTKEKNYRRCHHNIKRNHCFSALSLQKKKICYIRIDSMASARIDRAKQTEANAHWRPSIISSIGTQNKRNERRRKKKKNEYKLISSKRQKNKLALFILSRLVYKFVWGTFDCLL